MAKSSSSSSSNSENSGDLLCVGTLEIATPKPVGFLCGSIPVPTDKSFHSFHSALLPTPQTYLLSLSITNLFYIFLFLAVVLIEFLWECGFYRLCVCVSFSPLFGWFFRVNTPRYRYRMLPTETDLNTPPLLANFPEKVLPAGAVQSKTTGGGNFFQYWT